MSKHIYLSSLLSGGLQAMHMAFIAQQTVGKCGLHLGARCLDRALQKGGSGLDVQVSGTAFNYLGVGHLLSNGLLQELQIVTQALGQGGSLLLLAFLFLQEAMQIKQQNLTT